MAICGTGSSGLISQVAVYLAVMDCFRCGVCCHAYQPCLSLNEAMGLARGLGMGPDAFRRLYADPRWPGKRNILLRKQDEACVFLERINGRQTGCRIHHLRPRACREWRADVTKPECLEGLKLWGLSVSAEGRITGPPHAKSEFDAFVKSLRPETGTTSPLPARRGHRAGPPATPYL